MVITVCKYIPIWLCCIILNLFKQCLSINLTIFDNFFSVFIRPKTIIEDDKFLINNSRKWARSKPNQKIFYHIKIVLVSNICPWFCKCLRFLKPGFATFPNFVGCLNWPVLSSSNQHSLMMMAKIMNSILRLILTYILYYMSEEVDMVNNGNLFYYIWKSEK